MEAGWTERKRDGWPWIGSTPKIRVLRRGLGELVAYKLELAGLLVELARGACYAAAQLGVTMALEVRRLLERLEDGTADLARPDGAHLPRRVRCHLLGRCFKCSHRWFRGHRCPAVPAELPPLDAPVEPKPLPKPKPKFKPKPARKAGKMRPGPKPQNAGAHKVRKRSPQQAEKLRKARKVARKNEAKREEAFRKAERARCSKAMRALRARRKAVKKTAKKTTTKKAAKKASPKK